MISVGMGFPDAEREDMKDISAPHDFPFGELFSPRGIFFMEAAKQREKQESAES